MSFTFAHFDSSLIKSAPSQPITHRFTGKRLVHFNPQKCPEDYIMAKEASLRNVAPTVAPSTAPADDGAGPSTSAPQQPPVAPTAAPADSGVYVEPEEVAKARALQLQDRLQDRIAEMDRLAGVVGEEMEDVLAACTAVAKA